MEKCQYNFRHASKYLIIDIRYRASFVTKILFENFWNIVYALDGNVKEVYHLVWLED